MDLLTVEALSAEDTAAIRRVKERFSELLPARDFDTLVRLYTDDTVWMPPNEPEVRGRTALKNWMDAFPRVTRIVLETDEIEGCGDLAFVRGTYSMTLHPVGAPGPVDDTGKYLAIFRRQPEGPWLISRDIYNSDTC